MVGSSSQVRSYGRNARAARIAWSTVHFILASTISGKPSPKMLAHRPHPFDVLGQALATDLHLDGAETLGEIAFGLPQQLVGREFKIDAAGIAGHFCVEAPEVIP